MIKRKNGTWLVAGQPVEFEFKAGVNSTVDATLGEFVNKIKASRPMNNLERAQFAAEVMRKQRAAKEAAEATRQNEIKNLAWPELVRKSHAAGIPTFVKGANKASLVEQLLTIK